MPNTILDPTGRGGAAATPPAPAAVRAPRCGLAGARVGLMENTKHNAALLLDEIGALLVAEHGAAAVTLRRTKTTIALPASAELVAEFAQECDVVITGVGDCGSCSASAVADGVQFEQAGLPAAVICSDAFVTTADAMAQLRGAPGYRYVTTEHPVAVLTPQQVADRAKQVLPGVVALLTGGGA
ncbi:UGSC family (seleno)protein [Pseudonocardia nigra]|uniref:UGSC family (seleno)protein n=1 Tax=Pseudonocardia nigra TaxID=1921578 RepID=UPI001C5CDFEF|nr:UGSC family (seleno)protein [Pseudonocardia nigra]